MIYGGKDLWNRKREEVMDGVMVDLVVTDDERG